MIRIIYSYQKGFSLIFWGLLFAFLSFEINQVSILPSFIGFIIVLKGLKAIEKQDERIKPIFSWTYSLIAVSFVSWVTSFTRGDQTESLGYSQGGYIMDLPTINLYFVSSSLENLIMIGFVMLLMDYFILCLMENGHKIWENVFHKRRIFFVVMNVFLLIITPLVFIYPEILSFIFILVAFLTFIAMIRIIMAAHRMKRLATEEKINVVEDQIEKVFALRGKKVISVVAIIVICWGIGLIYVNQLHVSMPLLLPAFIATTEETNEDIHLYYLYNTDRNKEVTTINTFSAYDQNFSYREGFLAIKMITIDSLVSKEMMPMDTLDIRLQDGSVLENTDPYKMVKLEKAHKAHIERNDYIEFQGSRWGGDGIEASFKILQPFHMTEGFALPFKEELEEYFLYGWRVDHSPYSGIREADQYHEGDMVTFYIRPKVGEAGLATLQSPLRIEIEGQLYDLTWLHHQPSFSRDTVREYVQNNK